MSDYNTNYCKECGSLINIGAKVCPRCGSQQGGVSTEPEASEKSRLVALLLCYFLGVFGVHRFYSGRIFSGIMQIFFGWATLFIWWLVDFILIACGVFKDEKGLPIKDWKV